MEINTSGISIRKPATATDGYDGGLQVIRDTSTAVGGKRGMVNCGLLAKSVAGKDVKNFEWNSLFLLENHADEGENVALYAQGNKLGLGPTWGACVEACDTTENPSGTVGLEVDCWVTGADTGNRIGADIVVGDAKSTRGLGVSDKAEATAGIRIGTSNVSPKAKWTTGLVLAGNIGTGIDCTAASAQTAIKLNENQQIVIGNTVFSAAGVSTNTTYNVTNMAANNATKLSYAAIALSIISILVTLYYNISWPFNTL